MRVDSSPILVTGAAGFIGSHLAERLRAEGMSVVGLDNFSPFYDRSLKEANLEGLRADPGFDLIEGDIRDLDLMRKVLGRVRPHTVVHLAALAGVRPSWNDPPAYVATNIGGTTNLLEAAVEHEVAGLVLVSSSSVYGNNEKVPFSESDPVDFPISPYAATKRAAELIAHTYHHAHRVGVTCLRLFTVFGPRQRPDLAINRFMTAIADDAPITLFGDGSKSRDFTYVDDITSGIVGAVARLGRHGDFSIYNLGGDEPVTVLDLISMIEAVTGRTARIQHLPDQRGDVERTWADISRSRQDLGYQPATNLAAGLAVQWDWTLALRRQLGASGTHVEGGP